MRTRIKKNKLYIYIIAIIGIVIALIGASYAMYIFTGTGTRDNTITTGNPVIIEYEENDYIEINDMFPMPDDEGIAQEGVSSVMNFSITGQIGANYAIALDQVIDDIYLTDDYVKIYMTKNNNVVSAFTEGVGQTIKHFEQYYINGEVSQYVVYTDTFTANETHDYTLKAWIDESYVLPQTQNESATSHGVQTTKESFSFRIKVVGTDSNLVVLANTDLPVIQSISVQKEEEIAYTNISDNIKRLSAFQSASKYQATPLATTYNAITGPLVKNNKIRITVVYSKPVTGEPPSLSMKFGSNDSVGSASFVSMSGTESYYEYTIQQNDNGYLTITSLRGGSLIDERGISADLTLSSFAIESIRNILADNIAPICDTITGASTTWTKNNRTIGVACIDTLGTCSQPSFSTTFNTNTQIGSITISDKAGNTTSCNVNAYVDKTAPTCGTITGASTTWINTNRNISVACTDTFGQCDVASYSNNFTTNTQVGTITISDKAGNTTSCNVNAYVDKTAPSCEVLISGIIGLRDWYVSDVVLDVYGVDSLSGVDNKYLDFVSPPTTERDTYIHTSATTSATAYGKVDDLAGNSTSCNATFKRAVEPTLSISFSNSDYAIVYATDNTSGLNYVRGQWEPITCSAMSSNYVSNMANMVTYVQNCSGATSCSRTSYFESSTNTHIGCAVNMAGLARCTCSTWSGSSGGGSGSTSGTSGSGSEVTCEWVTINTGGKTSTACMNHCRNYYNGTGDIGADGDCYCLYEECS